VKPHNQANSPPLSDVVHLRDSLVIDDAANAWIATQLAEAATDYFTAFALAQAGTPSERAATSSATAGSPVIATVRRDHAYLPPKPMPTRPMMMILGRASIVP
jgi:hypothetical protein